MNATIGSDYDTLTTKNTSRLGRIIERLKVEDKVFWTGDEDEMTVWGMESAIHQIAGAMIESGCSFEYNYMQYNGGE